MKLSEKKMLRKKEQILLSAIKIINRRGYSGATMEEIASELLMTKGSLYYYFKNKSDLMYQCHNFVLSQAIFDLESIVIQQRSPEDILRQMIATHIEYAIEEKEVFNMIMEPKRFFNKEQLGFVLELRKKYEKLFDQVIRKGLESKEFETDEPIIIRMIILGSMNWIQQWFKAEGRLTKEEIKKMYSDKLLKLLMK
ncbi:TetR/AcrR family transcriptional regulator [Salirhabdus sp. Marseille-P4669]|uniref:TetR/AcrR family transcriptional regulator n=1 Tax=Salirhabdus sp. Marseille-P4669 TaxID=2042310 RepID=UPI000C79FB20|nr:TetR/AcrR family transcriptional regulator [Salirhabdus sp. Marseille-P4669]